MSGAIMPDKECVTKEKCIYYHLLYEISEIIRKDGYDDECFDKIEEIVCLFEKNNIDTGGRHDFG